MPHLANRHFKWPMDSSYPFERSRRVKFSEAIDKLISDCETSRRHKMSKSMWKTSPLPNSSINSHSIQNTPTTQKPLISDKSHPRLRTISPLNTEAYDLFSRPTSNRYDKQTESVRTTSEMMHTKHHQNQSNVLGATLNGEVEFSNCDTQPSTPNDEVDRHKTDSLVEDRRQTISIFNENETFLERPVVLEVQKPEHFRTIKTVRRSNKIEENEISDESNLRNLTDQSKSEEKAKSVAVEVSQLESSVKSTSNNKQAEKQNSIHMADSTPDQPVHIQSDLIKESVVHRTLREQVALSSDVCELNSSNKLPPSFHDTSHMLNNPAFSLRTTYENDAGVNETISSNTDICHTLSVKSVEDVHNHDINDEEHENASFHGDSTNQNESQTFSLSKEVLDPADTTEKIPEDSHVPKDTTQDESMKKEEQPKKGILQFLSSDERDDDDDDDDSFFDIPQPTNTTGKK